MTLQECYSALGGDYEDAINRLRSDKILQKFVFKFLDDKGYGMLLESMEAKDYEEACRAAHSIKGVCQNLSFTKLFESSRNLNDALRSGYSPEVPDLMAKVEEDYQQTVEAIRKLQDDPA